MQPFSQPLLCNFPGEEEGDGDSFGSNSGDSLFSLQSMQITALHLWLKDLRDALLEDVTKDDSMLAELFSLFVQ